MRTVRVSPSLKAATAPVVETAMAVLDSPSLEQLAIVSPQIARTAMSVRGLRLHRTREDCPPYTLHTSESSPPNIPVGLPRTPAHGVPRCARRRHPPCELGNPSMIGDQPDSPCVRNRT